MFAIQHSGLTWVSMGVAPSGRHIWPIEEYLARTRHPSRVAERIRELNPDGKEEGAAPLGLDLEAIY